jgi:hypothetical protein
MYADTFACFRSPHEPVHFCSFFFFFCVWWLVCSPQPLLGISEPTTGIEPVNLILTKDVLYRLSYMGTLSMSKRAMRFELTTATLEGWSSTIELCPHIFHGPGWFRTTVGVSQWIYSPSPLTTRAPTPALRADGGNQTPDHSITNRMLYQLSYIGVDFVDPFLGTPTLRADIRGGQRDSPSQRTGQIRQKPGKYNNGKDMVSNNCVPAGWKFPVAARWHSGATDTCA